MSENTSVRSIGIFLILTVILSSVFWTLIIISGHMRSDNMLYIVGVMWCPGIAALITCRLQRKPIAKLGWRWGEWRWIWLAYFVPLGYAIVAYLVVWNTGLGGFGNARWIASLGGVMGTPGWPLWFNMTLYFVLLGTVGMGRSLSALGEELGWRGFLAPMLVARFGFTPGALIGGLIWAAWHMPLLLFADYGVGTPWWFSIPCFVVQVVAFGVVLTWLRLRSGSLWPAAIAHASHNVFIQGFFTPVTAPRGSITPYAIDECGFVLPLVMLVCAMVFWHLRTTLYEQTTEGGRSASDPPHAHP
jgi:uncharacterized protein